MLSSDALPVSDIADDGLILNEYSQYLREWVTYSVH
jgi:hypothetical protein